MVYLNEKNTPDVTQVYFQQSLSLDLDQPDFMVIFKQGQGKQAKKPELPKAPNPATSNPQPAIPGLPTP